MIELTLAKRYAAALLKVTDAEGSTEEAEALLLALRDAYRGQKPFRDLLASPQVPRAMKKQILRKAFEGRARKSFIDFLELLVDRNRADILPQISEVFDRLADASAGVVRVKVRSWRPLTDPQRAALLSKLSGMTGKKIEIEAETDAALKGGMLVRIGDAVIDGTVARRLKVLSERFLELERR